MDVIKKNIYWVLPILVLSYVFTTIDFTKIKVILQNSTTLLILFSFLVLQFTVLVSALRFFFLLEWNVSFFYFPRNFVKKLIYWVLPIAILSYVFNKIDLTQLTTILKTSEPHLILSGVLMMQCTIVIGGLRWFFLLERKVPFFYLLKHYWIGLSLGVFMPASIGWDAYRVTIAGQKCGQYVKQISIILWEKIITLVNIFVIIFLLYPFLSLSYFQKALDDFYYLVIISLICAIFVFSILFLNKKYVKKILTIVMEKFKSITLVILRKIHKKLAIENYEIIKTFLGTLNFKFIFSAFLFSLFIQLSSSTATHFFFIALGYEISFLINLFVTPVLFLIFILPISFGGLGIREASFIMLYHLFGVPMEIALIVSFLGLFAMLINVAIGGGILLINKNNGYDKVS